MKTLKKWMNPGAKYDDQGAPYWNNWKDAEKARNRHELVGVALCIASGVAIMAAAFALAAIM